ncbi:MAG: hypothetical protein JWM36_202 [Hyphomicrobiales bacterium]|nr:hypothetical protein [Hyphomicrobiales bacterium]
MPYEALTLSISIRRPAQDVYEAIWRPLDFPKWASGLSAARLRLENGEWHADGPEGAVRLRFTGHNPFGIMDHWVDLGTGPAIYVPMRVIANGEGAEVSLMLFRHPGTTEEQFSADADWMRGDLLALRQMLTG